MSKPPRPELPTEISEAEGYRTLPDWMLDARIADLEGSNNPRTRASVKLLLAERDSRIKTRNKHK